MESVVASVSQYHGTERFKLIKLISQSGANYVGAMNRSTTHLVCWKFEGRKYDLAKQFNVLVVNHRWVEKCIKLGTRVPEQPYLLQSGHEVGPLRLEMPFVTEEVSQLNAHKDKRGPIIDIEHGMDGHLVGTHSRLLSESLYPEFGASNDTSWLNKKTKNESSRHGYSGSRCYEKEPVVSTLFGVEDEVPRSTSSMLLGRHETRSTNSTEPHCKGRRFVKKNIMDFFPSDSEQAGDPIRARQHQDDLTVPSRHSDAMRDKKRLRNRGASDAGLYDSGGNRNERLEDDEVVEDLNGICTFRDPNLHYEDAAAITERTFEVSYSNINDSLKGCEHAVRLPTSIDLSCVICWTDFSSTRGVLPCGHRFCFSCIQSWADVMSSRGKISTCPLCKASFVSITKVDGAASLDQKIYSQTIPHDPSGMDIFILHNSETLSFGPQSSALPACIECCCREPEDLLVRCHLCQIRCIHSYCLDPPLLPWTCIHCKDLQMLYHRIC